MPPKRKQPPSKLKEPPAKKKAPPVDEECFYFTSTRYCSPKNCLKDLMIKDVIGKGSYATVSEACLSGDCKYVVKILQEGYSYLTLKPTTRQRFEGEIELLKFASSLGVGPTLKTYFSCSGLPEGKTRGKKNFFFIVMNRYSMNLREYKKKYPQQFESNQDNISKKILGMLDKLYSKGVQYGDLKLDNILVNINPQHEITDIVFGDWDPEFIMEKQDPVLLSAARIAAEENLKDYL